MQMDLISILWSTLASGVSRSMRLHALIQDKNGVWDFVDGSNVSFIGIKRNRCSYLSWLSGVHLKSMSTVVRAVNLQVWWSLSFLLPYSQQDEVLHPGTQWKSRIMLWSLLCVGCPNIWIVFNSPSLLTGFLLPSISCKFHTFFIILVTLCSTIMCSDWVFTHLGSYLTIAKL